jgi:hypothetical protein
MKTKIKKVFIWLGLSVLMMIFWIIGLVIGNMIFPSNLMELSADSNSNSEPLFFLVSALNTWVILYFIYNSRFKGWTLAGILFLITFGIQYFMSQIETIWFNESLKLPINGIWAIITGGAIMYLLFSLAGTWLTGKFSPSNEQKAGQNKAHFLPMLKRIILLAVVVWPMVYFLAGYLIAWQFTEVRLFYSETSEMESFFSIMKENVSSGLYFFQIFRGIFWILIAYLVLSAVQGLRFHKGIILGLLFAILGSSGLLLPNPVMPYMVRMAHLIETAPSSFIWGFIIARVLGEFIGNEQNESARNIPLTEKV